MPGFAIDSRPTVIVYSPTLAEEGMIVSFRSTPSNSTLLRTVPQTSFVQDQGKALLDSLSDAVEQILGEGIATGATGSQGLDDFGLTYDAVTFAVEYDPPFPIPGRIRGDVEILVDVLTFDPAFGGATGVVTAPELILQEYNRLKALAGQ